MPLCEKILIFYKQLKIGRALPKGVKVLSPYQHKSTFELCESFYRKYYQDDRQRQRIVGINPGRFGGGLTGIPFTDPQKLELFCGISNELKKMPELSAEFIYNVIDAYGGLDLFYSQFYFNSVSPLGFTMEGKNLNYYDIPKLQTILKPFIVDCLEKQISFGLNPNTCFVLGEGRNFDYMKKLNQQFHFFKELIALPHPRFIMQCKRKKLMEYVELYVKTLGNNSRQ